MHVSEGNPVRFPELDWLYATGNSSKYMYSQGEIYLWTHHTYKHLCVYINIYIKTQVY